MDVLALRDRLVADGLKEIEAVYAQGSPEQDGARNGFTICLHLETREQFEEALARRRRRELEMIPVATEDLGGYWRHRYATLQVEWVLDCLKAACWGRAGDMVSARAAIKASEVLGALAAELAQMHEALEQLRLLKSLGVKPKGYQITSPYERRPLPSRGADEPTKREA